MAAAPATPARAIRRPGRPPLRHAREASTTASSAKNAGTASSITWLVYLTVQVWTARNRPPTGDTIASRTAVATPKAALTDAGDVEVGLREVRRRAPRSSGGPGSRATGSSGASASPVMILESGGCSVR